jgi:peptidoglycan hydrolase-like protein with peptidoglycan-binding domain
MLRKTAAALLLAALAVLAAVAPALAAADTQNIPIKEGEQSDNVILLQMRLQDLGYYNYKVTGFFGGFTKEALQDFQKQNGIGADGVAGEKTMAALYGDGVKRAKIEEAEPPKAKAPSAKSKIHGKYLDWFKTVRNMWKKGTKCKVVDYDTGISYYMVRVGGSYHADVAPATKADTDKFKKTYDGHWNWDRRAINVNIGGTWVAASTNGMPHGSTGVPGNGMNLSNGHLQQVCIHFLNSRTHIHNLIDPAHQYEIKRAAGMRVGAKPSQAS